MTASIASPITQARRGAGAAALCHLLWGSVPFILFGYAARRIRLSTLGLLQYLAPSVQLGLGVWVYHEPFPRARLVSFCLIWAALALYTVDNLLAQHRISSP